MILRRRLVTPLVVSALILGTVFVGGCSSPVPVPTPTPLFASDEEAFAAAEETYRAYVDALNHVDLSDPATFEDVFAWTTGDASAGERESLARLHADGSIVHGESEVLSTVGVSSSDDGRNVVIHACTDVSGVELFNADGSSAVDADRTNIQSIAVTLVLDTERAIPLIAALDGSDLPC